ncbi:nucleotidyltransferase domain-containing protein [Actinosynnema sp. CA-248983]
MSYEVPDLADVVAEQPKPLLFVTVSGAHLYGFPSRDSDVDLRGVHVLPVGEVVGLRHGPETLERMWVRDGVELDLVTHDVLKFCRLLLRPNGYVLEQLLSPLVEHTTPAHGRLCEIAPRCLTRWHARHYRGFARNQWRLFEKSGELKPLLYTFRALLTGVHLMRAGEVVANLPRLTEAHGGPGYLPDLVEAKALGEHRLLEGVPGRPDPARIAADVEHWHAVLEEAHERTALPAAPTAEPELDDFVLDLRLGR